MARPWSQQIAERYHVRLTPDVVAWFDDELWREPGGAEFNQPLTPEQLLDPEPGMIWAGFMLPDTLPLIGNQYGDWLCLHVAADGRTTEVRHWLHGGGDWTPYGRNLAEALLFDAAVRVLYERRPEFDEPEAPAEELFRFADWATNTLSISPQRLPRFWQLEDASACDPLAALLAADLSPIAVRHDLVLRCLDTELKARSNSLNAAKIGIPWEPDYVSWLFDTALTPPDRREQLSSHFGIGADELLRQDWNAAERYALEVARLRGDLGWAHDIAGWSAERRGDIAGAVVHYQAGIRPSLFSDATVKFRTHWFADGFGKFSAARLSELRQHLSSQVTDDPYLQLFLANENATLRSRLCDFWLTRARQAAAEQRSAEAYAAYYNAGWDLGLQSMNDVEEILNGLFTSATAAGWQALAALADLNRKNL